MLQRRLALSALIFLLTSLSALASGWDRQLDRRQGTVPAEGVRMLRVDVEAGSLEIIGESSGATLRYDAIFEGEDERTLDDLHFEHRVDGDTITIRTRTRSSRRGRSGRINLELRVPSYLMLDIADSSGSMRVSNMDLDVTIDDSSGSIDVDGVGGRLVIDDSSGSIEAYNIGGSVEIEDSSGSIRVEDVTGGVVVWDSSGSISVRNVGADFEVRRDGSGGISHRGVQGRVIIPSNKRR